MGKSHLDEGIFLWQMVRLAYQAIRCAYVEECCTCSSLYAYDVALMLCVRHTVWQAACKQQLLLSMQ